MTTSFAKALEMALIAGAVDYSEVVHWADRELERAERPAPDLIDLSLSSDLPTTLENLRSLAGATTCEASVRIFFRFLFRALRAGRMTHRHVAINLYRLTSDIHIGLDSPLSPMFRFDDELELSELGYLNTPLQKIEEELQVFLLAHMADGPPTLFDD